MLTKAEIIAASPALDSVDIEMWLALIRANPDYKANVNFYPAVESTLEDASGGPKGQMLNALSTRIQALGVGVSEIKGGDEGLNWSQAAERDAMVAYALSILYPVNGTVYAASSSSTGSFGDYQVRQRGLCGYCGYIRHSAWCRLYGLD